MSERIAVAVPLSLVVVGIALSFLPGLPKIDVDPHWILAGALLYATAVRMPAHDFRRDFKAIAGLAVLLVVLTTICSGLLFDALLPGLGLASALALGAIISPTDAVAATSVGRRLGLPSRLLTILEGEGLVNDASSLVLLSSAVAATTVTVHLWKVGLDFLYAVAVAVGLVVGYLNVRIRSLLKDPVLSTAVSFVVPFLAWVPAEELGDGGLPAGKRHFPAHGPAAQDLAGPGRRCEAERSPGPVDRPGRGRGGGGAAPGLEKLQSRVTDPELSHRFSARCIEHVVQRIGRQLADIDFFVAENFGWRGGIVLAWSGMRGVVTVAAAQSLPDGTPYRPQLVLIAFVVAGTTLLAQGLTLPRVIRILKISGDAAAAADRAEYGELNTELSGTALAILDDPGLCQPDGRPYPGEVLDRVREAARTRGGPSGPPAPGTADPREQYRRLMLQVLAAERAELLGARSAGACTSRALSRAQRALDLAEAALQQSRTSRTRSRPDRATGAVRAQGARRSRYSQPAQIWRSDQTSARLAMVSASPPQRSSGPADIAASWVRQARSSRTAVMIAVGVSGPTATMPCCGIRQALASLSVSASSAPSECVLIRPPVTVKRGMSG